MTRYIGHELKLSGDELYLDGELVALLTNNARLSTPMGAFLDFIRENEIIAEDDCECVHERSCPKHKAEDLRPNTFYSQALDDLEKQVRDIVKGGLLRIADFDNLLNSLRKGDPA